MKARILIIRPRAEMKLPRRIASQSRTSTRLCAASLSITRCNSRPGYARATSTRWRCRPLPSSSTAWLNSDGTAQLRQWLVGRHVERLGSQQRTDPLLELGGHERLLQDVVAEHIADRDHDHGLVKAQVPLGDGLALDRDRVVEAPWPVRVEVRFSRRPGLDRTGPG